MAKPKPKIPQGQGIPEKVGYKRPPRKTQFKPGQSGNPGGCPKGLSLTALLREALDLPSVDLRAGTNAQKIVARLVTLATVDGDRQAIKDIFDRVEGKTPDRIIDDTPTPEPSRTRDKLNAKLDGFAQRRRNEGTP